MSNKNNKCSFCGETGNDLAVIKTILEDEYKENPPMVCKACCAAGLTILEEYDKTNEFGLSETPLEDSIKAGEIKADLHYSDITPKSINSFLDERVIGQDDAKKTLSVAVYNHFKRISGQLDSNVEKSNVLLIGPTGTGKTLLARTIAEYLDIPMVIADSTSLTANGYVGEDASSVITKLYKNSGEDIERTQKGIVFIDEVDKLAYRDDGKPGRDITGEEVQNSLLKIIEGNKINVTIKGINGNANAQKDVEINTTDILFICAGSFPKLDDVIEQRTTKKKYIGYKLHSDEEEHNIMTNVTVEDVVTYGMTPEFMGRLPLITSLDNITEEMLVTILTEPKDSLVDQYKSLARADNVELSFSPESLKEIAKIALERKTGARGLRGVVDELLLDTMYNLPERANENIVLTYNKDKFECLVNGGT